MSIAVRRRMRAKNSLGDRAWETEEVPDLRRGDQQRDAVREANDDRTRDELHRPSEAGDRQTIRMTPAIIVTMSRPDSRARR